MRQYRKNIYKRKDMRYEGRYIAGYLGVYGKAFYRSIYSYSYKETVEILENAEKEVEEELKLQRMLRKQRNENQEPGILQQVLKKEDYEWVKRKLTVEEWMVEWLNDHKKNTIRQSSYTRYYNMIVNHIIPQIGCYKLTELSPNVVQELIKYFCEKAGSDKRGLASSTVRSYIVVLSAALDKAIEQEMLRVNPCKGVTLPLKKQNKPIYLEPDDCLKLQEILLKTDQDSRSVAILLALKTGLRLGELAALQWDNIDFKNKRIHISRSLQRVKTFKVNGPKTQTILVETKTDHSVKDIPMTQEIYQYLKMYYRYEINFFKAAIKDNTFVFRGQSGGFIDPRVYQQYLKKMLKKGGVKEVNFHALRHTFATIAASKDMQISVLSRIMGHANVALTLQLYVHSVSDQDRKEMAKIDWKFKTA